MDMCKIKEKRIQMGWTQKGLAAKANVTAQAISEYEKGNKTPSLESAVAIANALEVSVDWLCGNQNDDVENIFKTKDTITFENIAKAIISIDLKSELSFKEVVTDDGYMSVSYYELSIPQTPQYSPIEKFFVGWLKFKKMYDEKLIDREVLDLWIEKELKKLSLEDNLPF